MTISLCLNEMKLITEIIEIIPLDQIQYIITQITNINRLNILLHVIAKQLETSTYLQLYLLWTNMIFVTHGQMLKNHTNISLLRKFQQSIHYTRNDLTRICNENMYLLQYISKPKKFKYNTIQPEEKSEEE